MAEAETTIFHQINPPCPGSQGLAIKLSPPKEQSLIACTYCLLYSTVAQAVFEKWNADHMDIFYSPISDHEL
ncbi:hypothetical protein SK128_022942 [Halocaridina rubra]|uniref:Uncharacterized protein n=1 Tax=Halocaridina rubra TaxID=373956 RepID=A0AAN8WFC8_HALRR